MTDQFKTCQYSCLKCAPRTRTQALRRRRVSRVYLAPGKRRCRVLDAPGRHPVETQKNNLRTTCACLAVVSKEESCHDTMPSLL